MSNQQERLGARSAQQGSRLLSTHPTKTAAAAPRTLGPPLRRGGRGGALLKIGPSCSVKVRDAGLTSILFLHSSPTPCNRSDSRKTSISITNMSQKHIRTHPPSPACAPARKSARTRTSHTCTHTRVNGNCNIVSMTAPSAARLGERSNLQNTDTFLKIMTIKKKKKNSLIILTQTLTRAEVYYAQIL